MTTEPAPAPPVAIEKGDLGALLFEHRGWIHPTFLVSALIIGGARPVGIATGAVLLVAHLGLRWWCCRHIHGAARVHAAKAQRSGRALVTTGPFGRVRNPLYLANILALSGACLMLGPAWLALIAGLAAFGWYHLIVHWEEHLLDRLHPGYAPYRAAVARWLPGRRFAPASAKRAAYPWRKVLLRERGSAVLVLVVTALAMARALVG